jgi:hypothetical protein
MISGLSASIEHQFVVSRIFDKPESRADFQGRGLLGFFSPASARESNSKFIRTGSEWSK